MVRLLINSALFLACVGGGALLAAALVSDPGHVTIRWGGWIAETRATTLAGGVLAAVAGLWILVSLWSTLMGLPTALGGYARRRRRRKGLDSLGRALVAYAAEDGATALAHAKRAERFLAEPKLTRALVAKSLEMRGRVAEARRYFEALASNGDTAVAGVRGLLAAALREGDMEEAERQARRAIRLEPRNPVALSALLRLQVGERAWSEARRTVQDQVQARIISRESGRRKEAALFAAEAMDEEAGGDSEQARSFASRAAELDPGLAPAAAMAARLAAAAGDRKRADRFLLQAWKRDPMPELAELWMKTGDAGAPEEQRRRLRRLVDANPAHPESRLLLAEASVAQRDRLAALEAMEPIRGVAVPEARHCAVMAAIEKGVPGNEASARRWLARALTAPRGRGWRCDACGAKTATWKAACPKCDELASLSTAMFDEEAAPSSLQALPLPTPAAPPPLLPVGTGGEAESRPPRRRQPGGSTEPSRFEPSTPLSVVRPDA